MATQPMKLWEAVSAFRDDQETLATVFGTEPWRTAYFEAYSHFDELVLKQDRALLDTLLPLELTRAIASRYQKTKFLFHPREGILRIADTGSSTRDGHLEMTALEVHDQFGGSVIEEVLEYGSAHMASAPTIK
jgi:hypothetical protein